ncbi:MAG: DUF1398 family protein [Bacteroidetes bacterium]|nr:DUF1398 family protein [Bacteroidota bacterium]
MDTLHEKINAIYKTAKSYPEVVERLIALGIQTYTVDVASSTILYRNSEGRHVIHPGTHDLRLISAAFDTKKVIQAIRDNQQGKSDYSGFMNAIAEAGVRFYEATLVGAEKRVTYIGPQDHYEEKISL